MADDNKVQEETKRDFNPFDAVSVNVPSSTSPGYDPTDQNVDHQKGYDEFKFASVEELDNYARRFDEARMQNSGDENDIYTKNDSNGLAGPDMQYADINDVAKFIYQDDFKSEGFNPNDPNNHQRWVAKETWGSALSKGFDSFGGRFANTFTDYWKDYGRMANALTHFDATLLTPDQEEMMKLHNEDNIAGMKNYVFVDEETEDDIFSRKSISEFLGNAGFALGTMSAMTTELIADALITAATSGGGAGSFVLTGAKVSSLIAKGAAKVGMKKTIKKGVKEGLELGAEAGITKSAMQTAKTGVIGTEKSTKQAGGLLNEFFNKGTSLLDESVDVLKKKGNYAQQARYIADATHNSSIKKSIMKELHAIVSLNTEAIMKSKSFLEYAENIAKGVPVIGGGIRHGEKIYHAAKAGESTASLLGMGYRGMRRMGQEYNLAATEASFEAISTYGDALDKMIAQHEQDTGEPVTALELKNMKEHANKASFANYGTNMAILLATNKLQFGNLFNKFTPASRIGVELAKETAEGSGVYGVNKMFKSSLIAKVFDKPKFGGIYGIGLKISSDFTPKQAMYEINKHFLKGFGRFEISEGLQENMQEMSNTGWKNYYSGRVNGVMMTLGESFSEGAAQQFTKQGFKTFLQGALTGSVIRGPVSILTSTTEYINELNAKRGFKEGEDPVSKYKKQKKEDISSLNSFFEILGTSGLNSSMVNFQAQMGASIEQQEGAKHNSNYVFENGRDNALITAAITANRLGTIDTLIGAINQMGADMTAEQFEEAFGISIEDTKFSSPLEFANDVSNKLKQYNETVEKIKAKLKNNIEEPFIYDEGSYERYISAFTKNAQDDMISMIALNQIKADRSSERAEKVVSDYNGIEELSESSDYVFRVLANSKSIKPEKANLTSDIQRIESVLKEGGLTSKETSEYKTQLKDLKLELDYLNQWTKLWSNRQQVISNIDTETGENETGEDVVLDTFVGKMVKKPTTVKETKTKIKPVDQKGKKSKHGFFLVQPVKVEEEVVKDQAVYDLEHKDVRDLFKKIIELKNKQGGNKTKIHNSSLEDGFTKVVDFIKLDQDAKDYISGMEALYSKEIYKETFKRLSTGKIKAGIYDYTNGLQKNILNNVQFEFVKNFSHFNKDFDKDEDEESKLTSKMLRMQNVARSIVEKVIGSDAFSNLLTIAESSEMGEEETKYIQEQIKKLDNIIKQAYQDLISPNFDIKVNYLEVVSDEDYKDFKKTGDTTKEIKDAIAKILFDENGNEEALSVRQTNIYEKLRSDINDRVRELRDKEEDRKPKTPETPEEAEAKNSKSPEEKKVENPEEAEAKNSKEETTIPEDKSNEESLSKHKSFINNDEYSNEKDALTLEKATLYNDPEKNKERIAEINSLLEELEKKHKESQKSENEQNVPAEEIDNSKATEEQIQNIKNEEKAKEEEVIDSGAFVVEKDESKKRPYLVKDQNGDIVTSFKTEEKANARRDELNQHKKNIDFVSDFAKKETDKVGINNLGSDSLSQIKQVIETEMDKTNFDSESIEAFYNSTKQNKQAVEIIVDAYVKSGKEQKPVEEVVLEEAKASEIIKTNAEKTTEFIKSEEANNMIQELFNDLNNEAKIEATDSEKNATFESEEYSEESFLNDISDIKFSCKK